MVVYKGGTIGFHFGTVFVRMILNCSLKNGTIKVLVKCSVFSNCVAEKFSVCVFYVFGLDLHLRCTDFPLYT